MMTSLRTVCYAGLKLALVLSAIGLGIFAGPRTAQAGNYLVEATETQYDPDYEFRVTVWKRDPFGALYPIEVKPFNYDGATYNEFYGWIYNWSYSKVYTVGDFYDVIYQVDYRYPAGSGNWTYHYSSEAPLAN